MGWRIVMRVWRRWGWPGWLGGGGFCGGPGAEVGLAINTRFARSHKSCFRKGLLVRNACIFASFRKHAFAEILRFLKPSKIWSKAFASFRANLQVWFRSISGAMFCNLSQFMVSQAFASFHKLRKLSQVDFRKDSNVRKSWFFARIRLLMISYTYYNIILLYLYINRKISTNVC